MKNYRPEIDGLRAIAVISVIIYHSYITFLDYKILPGGFLGVDIFFVISGYLIASIILNEIREFNKFSFINFYERRARRILPALLLVIFSCLPVAYFILMPGEIIEFSYSLISSLAFISNIFFYYAGLVYGAENTLLKPLLHTWSLSVEEQFYLIFPILAILIIKFAKKYFFHILILGFFISLFYSIVTSQNNTELNFYIILSRSWELLVGVLLATLEQKYKRFFNKKIISEIFSIVGLILIIFGFCFYSDQMKLPSYLSLLPVGGTALIIWFASEDGVITKILSTKILVGIGLISYSLYLWHFPIFSFIRIGGFDPSKLNIFIISIFFIFVFSFLSFYFIEKPFRNKKRIARSKLILTTISAILLLIVVSAYAIYKNGEINYKNTAINNALMSPEYDDQICKFSTGDPNFFLEENAFTIRFNQCLKTKNKKFILVIGDSHGVDLFNSLSSLSSYDFIIGLNQKNCRPVNNKDCIFSNALYFAKMNKNKIKAILFKMKGSYMLTDISGGKFERLSSYRKIPIKKEIINQRLFYYAKLKKINYDTYFIGPHLEPNIKINRNIYKVLKNEESIKPLINFDLVEVDKYLKSIEYIENIKFNYISTIDLINYDYKNDFLVDNKFTFSDTDHWSKFGESYFGEKIFLHNDIQYLLR